MIGETTLAGTLARCEQAYNWRDNISLIIGLQSASWWSANIYCANCWPTIGAPIMVPPILARWLAVSCNSANPTWAGIPVSKGTLWSTSPLSSFPDHSELMSVFKSNAKNETQGLLLLFLLLLLRYIGFSARDIAPRVGWTPRVTRCNTPNTSQSSTLKYLGDTLFPASCVISFSIFWLSVSSIHR